MAGSKIICVDFDGVLHHYRTGWQGVDKITDTPVPGAIPFLIDLVSDPRFTCCIYSSRSKEEEGILAMRQWLLEYGLPPSVLREIQFPTQKPAAYMTIDDRAICFEGNFPTLEDLDAFQPWTRR